MQEISEAREGQSRRNWNNGG